MPTAPQSGVSELGCMKREVGLVSWVVVSRATNGMMMLLVNDLGWEKVDVAFF
jgi:hypothetical protein